MLVNTENEYIQTNVVGDKSLGAEYTIKASAHAFKILSSSIYEHKIAAVVREICANAKDAHTAAGNDGQPFSVVIPNDFHPYFEVEDFGIGMDQQTLLELYSTYFGTTKSGSNDAIGGLGIGSKSVFSYTKQFTVRSRKDGVENTALVYIGANGSPRIDIVSSIPTSEPNGTKVTVPVSPNDYQEFESEASYFLSFYPLKPLVNIDLTFMYDGVGPALEKNESAYVSRANKMTAALAQSNFYVLMGPVAYPVDVMSFVTDSTTREFLRHGLANDRTGTANQALFVKFEIGELEVAASRESLSLDEDTRQLVLDRFTKSARQKADELIAIACNDKMHPADIVNAINAEYGHLGMFLNLARQKSARLDKFMRKEFVFPRLERYSTYRWDRSTTTRKVSFKWDYKDGLYGREMEIRQIDTDKPQHKTLFQSGMLVYNGLMTPTMVSRIERILRVKIKLTKYSEVYEAYLAERRANRKQGAYTAYAKTNISAAGFTIKTSTRDEEGVQVKIGGSYSFQKQRLDISPEDTYYLNLREDFYPCADYEFEALFDTMVTIDSSMEGIKVVRINDQNKGKITRAGIKNLKTLVESFALEHKDEIAMRHEAVWWQEKIHRNKMLMILMEANSRTIPKAFHELFKNRPTSGGFENTISDNVLRLLGNPKSTATKMRDNFWMFIQKRLDNIKDSVYPVVSTYLQYRNASPERRQQLIEIVEMIDAKNAANEQKGEE